MCFDDDKRTSLLQQGNKITVVKRFTVLDHDFLFSCTEFLIFETKTEIDLRWRRKKIAKTLRKLLTDGPILDQLVKSRCVRTMTPRTNWHWS
jgi:hypothetical protein